MRIVCPSCAAEYEVPASRMTPRRMVRCARCGGEWMAVREVDQPRPADEPPKIPQDHEPKPVTEPSPLPPLTAMDRLAVAVPQSHRRIGLRAAWVMTLMILGAAAVAAIVWRGPLTRAWPPVGRILGSSDLEAPAPSAAKVPEPSHPAGE